MLVAVAAVARIKPVSQPKYGTDREHQSFLRPDDDDDQHCDEQDAETLGDETADSAEIWAGHEIGGKHWIQMFIAWCKNHSTLSAAFLQQNKHDARFIEFVKYT